MHISENPVVWQLRLFGEYMDRSMGSRPDPRVSFEPDAWQRDVLDCLDMGNCSALVVGMVFPVMLHILHTDLCKIAPTSAGKTFISFYAMEKVLRDSDDGILVYVAPTKALVNQVAAEVYARFTKEMKSGQSTAGMFDRVCLISVSAGTLWSIHTRDYRIHDPQNCQILVTVPDMLAIMLLSSSSAHSWTPRIKR